VSPVAGCWYLLLPFVRVCVYLNVDGLEYTLYITAIRNIRAVRRRRRAAAADILLTPPPPIITDRRAAAAAADRMSASRRRRFREVFTSRCTPAICCWISEMPFTMNLQHWQKAVRTMRACFAVALDTQMKHRGVRAKVFWWTTLWKWKLMLKVSYRTSLQIRLIQRTVQWKISTACTVITAYKVAKSKRTKTLPARRICHNILNIW